MDCQDTKGVETLPNISTSRAGRTNITDDRRPTDGRQHYSEREFTLATNRDEVTASVHSETFFSDCRMANGPFFSVPFRGSETRTVGLVVDISVHPGR